MVRSLWSASFGSNAIASIALKWPSMRSRRSSRVASRGSRPARRSAVCRKIQGFFMVARPIMTASQPVCRNISRASAGVSTSPLPTTGIERCAFNSPIRSRSARPVYICRAVRACIATAATPSSSHMRPRSRKLIRPVSSPSRNFTVRGMVSRRLTSRTMSRARGRSPINAAPEHPFRTLFAGQPMLMSQTSGESSWTMSAAAAIRAASEP